MPTESFFELEDEDDVGLRVRATTLTRGPWSPTLQHGGPPSALLAHAIERRDPQPGMVTTRVAVDFLRPVPIGPLAVTAEVTRPGKKVRLAEARLSTPEGEGLLVLRSLRMRTTELPPELTAPPRDARPTPVELCAPYSFSFFVESEGYHTAMELRRAKGEFGTGALAAWMRARVPLFRGTELRPLERVMLAVDSGNGLSVALDLARATFVNPDLTVHLTRELEGEWLYLDAVTYTERIGTGLAEAALSDHRGRLGRSLQSLFVEERR